MENFAAVNRERFFMEVQRMINTWLNGAINGIGAEARPVVLFAGIDEIDASDVLDIFIAIFERCD